MENSAFASLSNNAVYAANNIVGDSGSYKIVLIVVGVLLVLSGIVYVYYDKLFGGVPTAPPASQHLPAQQPLPPMLTPVWCFVGEDLSGRYCVRVPSEHSCDPNRTFASRESCELTPAQHLPAGLSLNSDTKLTPLGSLNIS